ARMSEPTLRLLRRIVGSFPQPMSACFAYGSAVFEQSGRVRGSGMLDLVFVVPDSRAWHEANLARHRSHYSGLGSLGAGAVARIQEGLGAGVYFNTLVPAAEGRTVKYGVVSVDSLLADLTEWRWLYLAGRLHKPVAWVVEPDSTGQDCPRLSEALDANRTAALAAGLLTLLPDSRVDRRRLLAAVCGLSYGGDVRMTFAEDSGKVQNIAVPQAPLLTDIYRPLAAKRLPFLTWQQQDSADSNDDVITWTAEPDQLAELIACLPAPLASELTAPLQSGASARDIAKILRSRLRRIVSRSSLGQTAKSAVTAGVLKSVRYGGAKVAKWFASVAPWLTKR
ncbi:hypothetical protein BOX15_Mlig024043g2, partial [Macrostomum lignano]